MNILLIDTSFNDLQLTVYKDLYQTRFSNPLTDDIRYQVFYTSVPASNSLGETVHDVLDDFLESAKLKIRDINIIAFNRGPGSFAGTRISTSIAQGLLSVTPSMKAVGLSSLQMVAAQVSYVNKLASKKFYDPESNLLVALDANMSEAYIGNYKTTLEASQAPKLVGTEQVISLDNLQLLSEFVLTSHAKRREILDNNPILTTLGLKADVEYVLVGNAWSKYLPHAHDLSKVLVNSEYLSRSGVCAEDALVDLFAQHKFNNFDRTRLEEECDKITRSFGLLPDLRLQAELVFSNISAHKFVERTLLEPNYIRDNVAHPSRKVRI